MDATLLAQYVFVALAVIVSAGCVLVRQFPASTRRLRVALAISLLRTGRPGWRRWLARRIAPARAAAGSSCGHCNGCNDGGRSAD